LLMRIELLDLFYKDLIYSFATNKIYAFTSVLLSLGKGFIG